METREGLCIYIAHRDESVRRNIARYVANLNHHVEAVVASGKALIGACGRKTPDLIVSGSHFQDMDGVSALKRAYERGPFPAILATRPRDIDHKVAKALEDHVMVCLTDPVREEDLQANIPLVCHRFKSLHGLWQENRRLREMLRYRKIIEQAKGILMKQQGIDEEEAQRELEKMAMESRLKLAIIAETLVQAVSYGTTVSDQKEIDS